MDRNIIIVIGIVAVLIVGGLWATGVFDNFVSPIEATDFSGEWKQEIVVTYADGTSKTIGNAGTATLYHDGAKATNIETFLYINPTNVEGGSFVTLTLDFGTDFNQMWTMTSPSGTVEVDSLSGITYNGDQLSDIGPRSFQIGTGRQLIGETSMNLATIDQYILAETGDYVMKIYYVGDVDYTLDGGLVGNVPAPDGIITVDFSRALTAGIINFSWSTTPVVS